MFFTPFSIYSIMCVSSYEILKKFVIIAIAVMSIGRKRYVYDKCV